jgi:glycosyltransferase involved in cell wall biosynthesis
MQTSDGVRWAKVSFPTVSACKIENPIYRRTSLTGLQKISKPKKNPESIILVVGRLERQKRIDIAIKIFSRIHDEFPEFKLVIIGKGADECKLRALGKQLGISEKIFFEGFTDFPELWYQKADLLLVTSEYEGFPNVILEAMSYRVPVISNNCKTGPAEIIKDKFNGLLIEENNIERFVDGIRIVLKNQRNTEVMVSRAFNSLEKFDMSVIYKKWIDIIYN